MRRRHPVGERFDAITLPHAGEWPAPANVATCCADLGSVPTHPSATCFGVEKRLLQLVAADGLKNAQRK